VFVAEFTKARNLTGSDAEQALLRAVAVVAALW
jgi:hypothetical protein